MKANFYFFLKSICTIVLCSIIIWACKKKEDELKPEPPVIEEEVIPGKTVGYGGVFLEEADYKKIKLIQEPQIPNARIQKEPKLTATYDFSANMPPVASQGMLGSCTSWAVVYASRSYFNHTLKSFNYKNSDGQRNDATVFSPAYVFNQLNGGQNKGIAIPSALSLLTEQGVCTWQDMPYKDTDFTSQPNAEQKQKASAYKIKDWGRVDVDVNVFRKFIYYDHPIIIAQRIDTFFDRLVDKDSTGEWIVKKYTGESSRGAHAMVIVGYDDNRKAFKIQNSWGPKWGNKGFIWLSYAVVTQVIREAYIMIPGEKPSNLVNPSLVTKEAGAIANGQIQLTANFTTLGDQPIIRYGICVSNTTTEPTDKIEVVNKPLTSNTQTFSVQAAAAGPKLYFRAFAETVYGIYYGNTIIKEIKTVDSGVLDKALLFAGTTGTLDPATGSLLAEFPSSLSPSFYNEGVTLTKSQYFYINTYNVIISNNIADNQPKWQYNVGGTLFGYVVSNEKIACFSNHNSIIALDLTTGAKKWEYKSSTYAGQPVIKDDKVYFGRVDKGVLALDANTGVVVKEFAKVCGRNTPLIQDGLLYYITASGVVAYNLTSGAVAWEFDGKGYFGNSLDRGTRLVYAAGKLICSVFLNSKSKMMALDIKNGTVAWEQEIFTSVGKDKMSVDEGVFCYVIRTPDYQVKIVALDVATGNQKWEEKIVLPSGNDETLYDVLVVGSSVFVSGIAGSVRSLNSQTGKQNWEADYHVVGSPMRPTLITKEGKAYHAPGMGM